MTKTRSWTEIELIEAVKTSTSMRQVLIKIGLKPAGGNHRQLKSYIEECKIDTSHFLGRAHIRGKTHNWSVKIPLSDILILNSKYTSSNHLRKRLIKEGLLKPSCSSCKLDTWLGQPLRLELDHINGDNADNRISNLRILCPNCHSQTPTYRGKNKG